MFYFTATFCISMIKQYVKRVINSACKRSYKMTVKSEKLGNKAARADEVAKRFEGIKLDE